MPFDYTRLREHAYTLGEAQAAGSVPPIAARITGIDVIALAAYRESWKGLHPSGYGGFDWVQLWHRHCRHGTRSFHCALWSGAELCGLAIGTVPRSHTFLTIRCMEGRPGGHPLQGEVARIILGVAAYYASRLLIPQIRIENPAPGVLPMYDDLGYIIAFKEGATRYLAMNLLQEKPGDDDFHPGHTGKR